MKLYFDHIVHVVNDPNVVKNEFQRLGFHAVNGGNHPSWGTYNTLCYYKNLKYVEWIGIKDKKVIYSSDHPFSKMILQQANKAEGFSQIALRTHHMQELVENLKAKGLNVLGPFEGSRKRADGKQIRWSMLFLEEQFNMPLPFFIDWQKPDDQREKELVQHHVMADHSIGQTDITYIGYVVQELEANVERWVQWFDAECQNQSVSYDPSTQSEYVSITLGGVTINFFKPHQEGIASDFLQRNGEGPFMTGISNRNFERSYIIKGGYYHFHKTR